MYKSIPHTSIHTSIPSRMVSAPTIRPTFYIQDVVKQTTDQEELMQLAYFNHI